MMRLLLLFVSTISFGAEPVLTRGFATDYCTGYRDGTRSRKITWQHCCVEHDLYLWAGGARKLRKSIDLNLKHCVEDTGAKLDAALMYAGTRLGAASPFKIKGKQWGNAWGDLVRDQDLSAEEIAALEASLYEHTDHPLTSDEIHRFIENLKSRNAENQILHKR